MYKINKYVMIMNYSCLQSQNEVGVSRTTAALASVVQLMSPLMTSSAGTQLRSSHATNRPKRDNILYNSSTTN